MDFASVLTTIGAALIAIFYKSFEFITVFYQAIFVDNPLLLLFVILPLVGLGVGLIKRILN